MKIKLIEDWKESWRLYTVQFWAALAVIPQALYQLALVLGDVLPGLSSVVVDYLPPELRAVLAVAGAVSVFLRLWAQPGIKPPTGAP